MQINLINEDGAYKIDSWDIPVNQAVQGNGGPPIWFDATITNVQPDDRLHGEGFPVGDPIWFDKGQSISPTELQELQSLMAHFLIQVVVV